MIGNAESIITFLFNQERGKLFEVKEYKQKRSLTQNAYFWVLINEIASEMKVSKEEVHFNLLKAYGQCEIVSVLSNINCAGYFKYYEEIGRGYVDGKEFTHYRLYKGSSDMDVREMRILIDGAVQEATQLGIPTLTPAEIERLKP